LFDANNSTLSSATYGAALAGRPNAASIAPNNISPLGDIDTITITNAEFFTNGGSAPIGSGNGIIMVGDKMSTIDINNSTSSRNDDHGVLLTSTNDLSDTTVSDSTFEGNDRNQDSVGAGVFFDSTDDMDSVSATNIVSNGNASGVRFDVKGQNGRDLIVRDSTINDNDNEGIFVDGTDDISGVEFTGNTLERNATGIVVRSVDRGSDTLIDSNTIIGDNGQGTGISIEAVGVVVTNNSIRKNATGIAARRSENGAVNNNNIARNEDFGIDTSGLKPGEVLDATNNWWGEPSGPKNSSNPNGLGDRVSTKTTYDPWLGQPAVATDVNFQITAFDVPDTAALGDSVTISATIRNNGTEEGSQQVNLKIEGSEFINSNTETRTLNPATESTVQFDVVFPHGGTFTVTLSTQNDSQSSEITITGSTGLTIESVCDANSNSRIDDDEILTCIGFWVSGDEVPGTGQTINDAKILFLIELWVTGGDISTLPASASSPASTGWLENVLNFFQ